MKNKEGQRVEVINFKYWGEESSISRENLQLELDKVESGDMERVLKIIKDMFPHEGFSFVTTDPGTLMLSAPYLKKEIVLSSVDNYPQGF